LGEGIIYRAYSKESFLNKIRKAFFEDCEEYRRKRIQIAAENSWDQRGSDLKLLIDNLQKNLSNSGLDLKYK